MGSFPFRLSWTVLKSGRRRLDDAFVYILDADQANELGLERITVEEGFICDGGSIPRLFWSFASPYTGKAVKGYVIHDWLYEHPELCGGYLANRIMKQCHKDSGVGWFKRNMIFSAVQGYAFVTRK